MRLEVWILKQVIEISVFFSFKGDLELMFFLGAKIGDFWPFLKSRVETRCSRLSMLASLDARVSRCSRLSMPRVSDCTSLLITAFQAFAKRRMNLTSFRSKMQTCGPKSLKWV